MPRPTIDGIEKMSLVLAVFAAFFILGLMSSSGNKGTALIGLILFIIAILVSLK